MKYFGYTMAIMAAVGLSIVFGVKYVINFLCKPSTIVALVVTYCLYFLSTGQVVHVQIDKFNSPIQVEMSK